MQLKSYFAANEIVPEVDVFLKTDIEVPPPTETKSIKPSPFTSPAAMPVTADATVKFVLVAKPAVANTPEVPDAFRTTLTLALFAPLAISVLPSPSKSATAIKSPISYQFEFPVAEVTFIGLTNDLLPIAAAEILVLVTLNGVLLCPILPGVVVLFTTVITSCVDPFGTVTVKLVAVAADIVALAPPKKTILLANVVEKLVPVIVTVVPTSPLVGLKEETVGA